jgi:hypothetical protein
MSFKPVFDFNNTPLTPLKGGIARCSNFSNALCVKQQKGCTSALGKA